MAVGQGILVERVDAVQSIGDILLEEMTTPATVDDYLASLPDGPRAALGDLRATIRTAAPDATESISYQMPTFKERGRFLVSYAAFKDHCSLFPASEAVREALGEELEPYLSGKGTTGYWPMRRSRPRW